jgi:hypothetical protein
LAKRSNKDVVAIVGFDIIDNWWLIWFLGGDLVKYAFISVRLSLSWFSWLICAWLEMEFGSS